MQTVPSAAPQRAPPLLAAAAAAATSSRRAADVAVVGGSLQAYAAAYLLAKRGKRTVLVEHAAPQLVGVTPSARPDVALHLPAASSHAVRWAGSEQWVMLCVMCLLLSRTILAAIHALACTAGHAHAAHTLSSTCLPGQPTIHHPNPAYSAARPQRPSHCGAALKQVQRAPVACCTCAAALM